MIGGYRLALTLGACFLALIVLDSALRSNPRQRNYEAFTEMVYSRAGESQSRSASLPGGMTEQPLVDGVIVRGQRPFPFGTGPEEAQRAGRELANPFAPGHGADSGDGLAELVANLAAG